MDREARIILVHKVLGNGSQKEAEKTVELLKKNVRDVYDHMVDKYNSMSLEYFDMYLRSAYEGDASGGCIALEPNIDEMIKAGIKELADG